MEHIPESNWTHWTNVESRPKFHQFEFETIDIVYWGTFLNSYSSHFALVAVTVYLGGVFLLTQFMKRREAFQLRKSLFIWNATVGLISMFAMTRIGAELLVVVKKPHGFYKSLCVREGLHMSTAFWTVFISFSKPFFMLDTFFLILRKRHVDGVHVLHHALAMIFCPILAEFAEPVLRWVGVANLFTHSVDYTLLALQAIRVPVPKTKYIMVSLEVVQMIFVLLITVYTVLMKFLGVYCLRNPKSIVITSTIYFGLLVFLVIEVISSSPMVGQWKHSNSKSTKTTSNIDIARKDMKG